MGGRKMQRGQMIFLILMLCSAIVTGTTIGIAANFPLLTQHIQSTADQAAESEPALPAQQQSADREAGSINIASSEARNRSNQMMVITAEEKNEIRSMLEQLGMSSDQDEAEFIREFQISNSLSPTGSLDSQTLNMMIKQATLNKASRSLSNR